MGFGNNGISSLRIPSGLKVMLYDGYEPGTGNKVRYTGDVKCLPSDWNDRAQSVVIEADNTGSSSGNNQGGNYPVYPSYGSSGGPQVILYEDCSLMGHNVGLNPGRYDTRAMGIRNDAISSMRIPKGYSVTVYKEGGFRGDNQTFYANVFCMDGRWNDQVSSLEIRGPGGSGSSSNYPSYPSNSGSSGDKVRVYDQCNFGGASGALPSGRYKSGYLLVGNDRISSLRIPRGFRVTVYENDDFNGYSRTFTGDQYCLDGQWNNVISSMVIEGPGGSNNDFFEHSGSNDGNGYSGVNVYSDSWYRGNHTVFGQGYHDLRNGSLQANISSLSIQQGFRVTVYEDFNYRGRSQTFTSSVPNLSVFGWNDKIRSILVTGNY
jgi:hypothetical protein